MSKKDKDLKKAIQMLEAAALKVEDLDYELNNVIAMLNYLQALRDYLKDLEC